MEQLTEKERIRLAGWKGILLLTKFSGLGHARAKDLAFTAVLITLTL